MKIVKREYTEIEDLTVTPTFSKNKTQYIIGGVEDKGIVQVFIDENGCRVKFSPEVSELRLDTLKELLGLIEKTISEKEV